MSVHISAHKSTYTSLHMPCTKVGDITITLTWDTRDDLDLHVHTPDGSEIYYGRTRANGGYIVVACTGMAFVVVAYVVMA